MLDFDKLQLGEVLSEASFFTVDRIKTDFGEAILTDAHGNSVTLSRKYLEQILGSANQYVAEEKISQTDIITKLMENPRTACSIYFRKKDDKKLVKDFKAEKAAKIKEVQNASLSKAEDLLHNLIDNPISKVIPGEMRLIKGYHLGTRDDRGRINFVDMEVKDPTRRFKGVDTRTIAYAIINNVKYIKK